MFWMALIGETPVSLTGDISGAWQAKTGITLDVENMMSIGMLEGGPLVRKKFLYSKDGYLEKPPHHYSQTPLI